MSIRLTALACFPLLSHVNSHSTTLPLDQSRCTTLARSVVKEAVKPKYQAREQYHFIKTTFTPGQKPEKVVYSNVVKGGVQV